MNGRQLVEEALRLKPGSEGHHRLRLFHQRAGDAALPGACRHLTKPFDMQQLRKRALEA